MSWPVVVVGWLTRSYAPHQRKLGCQNRHMAALLPSLASRIVPHNALSLQPLELQQEPQLQALARRVFAASNETTAGFRFAVMSDTHFWLPSTSRGDWSRQSDAQPERDGLLVSDSDAVLQQLLAELAQFAASGGLFGVHAGDAVCGGGSFHQPPHEYERALRAILDQQSAILGSWPVFHVPGNHVRRSRLGRVQRPSPLLLTWARPRLRVSQDIDPIEGGLSKWRRTLGASGMANGSSHAAAVGVGYRAVQPAAGWRLLLLDSMDGVAHDRDGHGHIGEAQLAWLAAQLDESAAASEQVVLVMHQLLVSPVEEGPEGEDDAPLPGWLDWRGDFIDNREEVLALLRRHSHVRRSLHAHHDLLVISPGPRPDLPLRCASRCTATCTPTRSPRATGSPS